MACCLGIFLTGVTPIVMVLGYESAYPVSEGTTESLMQLGANGWGLICLLAVNGIFQGNHMGTLVFFLAGTVLSLVTYHDDKGSLPQGTPHRMTGSAAPNPIFSLAPPFPSGMAEPFRSVPRQIPIKAVPFSLTARLWCGRILR